MTWERTAKRYLAAFETARRGRVLNAVAGSSQPRALPAMAPPPEMQTGHLLSMCDDTGLFQHAVHSCRTARMAIASMTMPALCSSPMLDQYR